MKTHIALVAVLLLVSPLLSAQSPSSQRPSSQRHYGASEIASAEKAAISEGKPTGNSAKPLVTTPSHRVVLRYRAVDARPEMHTAISEVFLIRSGKGAIRIGGHLVNPEPESNDKLTMMGPRIEGGTLYRVGAGDVVSVPVGVAHGWEFKKGEAITYTLIQITESGVNGR